MLDVGHGPQDAFYSNLPGPEQTPIIQCLCGWVSYMGNHDWESVGLEFDEHLKKSKEGK